MGLALSSSKLPHRLVQTFSSAGFNESDIRIVAIMLREVEQHNQPDQCWDLNLIKDKFRGREGNRFTTSHSSIPYYKGRDLRPLILAIYGVYPDELRNKVRLIRTGRCNCSHCINKDHYMYGDYLDYRIEKWKRKGHLIDRKIYATIQDMRTSDPKSFTYKKLATYFNLNQSVIRVICNDA